MAIAFSYGNRLLPSLSLLRTVQTIQTKPIATVPVVTAIKPATVTPLIAPVLRTDAAYTPLAAPAPVLQAAPATAAEPVVVTGVGDKPKPCSDCGGKVTETAAAAPAAPVPSASVAAPVAAAAVAAAEPTPTPTVEVAAAAAMKKAGRGWLVALAIVGVLVAGFAFASAVRPRK